MYLILLRYRNTFVEFSGIKFMYDVVTIRFARSKQQQQPLCISSAHLQINEKSTRYNAYFSALNFSKYLKNRLFSDISACFHLWKTFSTGFSLNISDPDIFNLKTLGRGGNYTLFNTHVFVLQLLTVSERGFSAVFSGVNCLQFKIKNVTQKRFNSASARTAPASFFTLIREQMKSCSGAVLLCSV
ncbi:hypothetical protein MmiAt1_17760 [Methanimicrococcus sp. At1]|uniref:Uncharacterized protein n=1 Tax=Methanimicrococcus hacksteinii TaxID=3028293 RepID=A0ABU3VRX5_9EURY|nr:hypothetical protein [Methanimicrococcus sp. At1]